MKQFKILLTWIAICTVFTEAVTIPFMGVYNFKIYNIVLSCLSLIFLFLVPNISFSRRFVLFFLSVFGFSIINVFLGNAEIKEVLKQFFGILVNGICFYWLIQLNEFDLRKLFSIYLKLAFLVAVIGMIQEVAFMAYSVRNIVFLRHFFDFKYLFPYNWQVTRAGISALMILRVNSVMPEPTSFCLVMMPAFLVSITTFFNQDVFFLSKWKSLVIILSFFLTFSAVGYLGVIFALVLVLFNFIKPRLAIVLCSIVFLFAVIVYFNVNDISRRVDDTFDVAIGESDWQQTNQSTYTMARNFLVTLDVLKKNFLFGNGIGSHERSFELYTDKNRIKDPFADYGILVLNKKDANSLLLRVASEMGLFGIIVLFLFIYKNYLHRVVDTTNYLWIINNAVLVVLLMRLIRQGHYFSEGFFFFFWLYYFSKKKSERKDTSFAV